MLDADTWDFFQADQLCRLDAPVTGKDGTLSIDQDRIGEAEGADALGDLLHLLAGVGARVLRPGAECVGRDHFNLWVHALSLPNR